MRMKTSVFTGVFFLSKEEKMKLKKIASKMFKHMVNPALIFGITPGFATASVHGYNDAKKERNQIRQEKQQAAEQVVKQEAAAEKNDFLNQLDEKRRRGRKSNVVFAGLLGGNSSVGLGGRKSLLGL